MTDPVIRSEEPVSPKTLLYRRIHPSAHLKPPIGKEIPEGECRRVSSAVFKQRPRGSPISVVLGDEMKRHGRHPRSILNPHYSSQFLIRFQASEAVKLSLVVIRTEDVKGRELAHGDLAGSLTESGAKKLIAVSEWEVAPKGACDRPSGKAWTSAVV